MMTNQAESLMQQGIAMHQAGNVAGAAQCYEAVLSTLPRHGEALHLLGVCHDQQGNPARAAELIRTALTLMPRHAEAHNNLGLALEALGEIDAAQESFARAVECDASYSEAWFNCARHHLHRYENEDAERALRTLTAQVPQHFEAWRMLGVALQQQQRFDAALECFERAASLAPDDAESHNARALILQASGRIPQALEAFRTAMALAPGALELRSQYLLACNYDPAITAQDLRREAEDWAARCVAAPGFMPCAPQIDMSDPKRPLRVGYVSGDLRHHPVGFFLECVVAAHDPSQVEAFAYANHQGGDDVTEALKPHFSAWREIIDLDDAAVADLVMQDRIDILIDLSGHTAGQRLGVFARKPAPLQATWMGYGGTTGVSAIDYIIADALLLPAGTEAECTEAPLYLPESYLCLTPPPLDVPVAALPAQQNGFVTFGSFNYFSKIHDGVIDLWARILRETPGSRLFLKTQALAMPSVQARVRDAFAAHGIAPERLRLEPAAPRGELLKAYGEVDIALDPFPYTGGTTTAEALWMGVPVVTLRGERLLARIAASIVTASGHAQWVADSHETYAATVHQLAADLPALAAARAALRGQVEASALCDAPRFTRHFEAALRRAWGEKSGG